MTKHDLDLSWITPPDDDKTRLDVFLSRNIAAFSRSQIQAWIASDCVKIDEKICNTAKTKLKTGQKVAICASPPVQLTDQPESRPLVILHEDDDILLINKPPGLVVHPGAGNRAGTLLNALLHHCPDAETLPRAGIVHRLDKDTSGVMMVAKTPLAFQSLTHALAERTISRRYYAIADGVVKHSQSIHTQMGRHPVSRQKMAVVAHGKEAITHITIAQRLGPYTLLDIHLDTGRTHQIRVHMQHIGHPLLGDPTYGRHRGYQKLPTELAQAVLALPRQALHAYSLTLDHPVTQETMTFTCPVPEDMQSLIDLLDQAPLC